MAGDMSSEELRSHLFRSLQGRGVLDSLKSQLRNRLATALQRSLEASIGSTPPGQVSSSPPAANKRGNSMILQVANSIVVEHLKRAGYEYALSVFLPEAGVNVDKVFSYEEILQFLKISDQTLHQALLSDQEQGFLLQLLEGLLACGVSPNKESAATQTEEQQSQRTRSSVAAKLQALDESYAHKAAEETIKCHQALEERMAVFQRECEVRYQGQLKTEMARFRERELAQARREERERWREEVGRERGELQEAHRRKMEAMRRMELETLERLRRKEQDLEAGVYSQRQALLSELDALKVREAELKRQEELNKKAASLEKEHAKALMEQLASKERALQQMKEHYEQMAEERVQKYRLECEGKHQSKREELVKWELELTAKQERLSVLESECQRVGGELREERGRVERLQELLHETTSKQVALQQQKEALQQRLAQMSNYPQLKQNVSELQQQLQATEKRLSETKMEHKRKSSEQQHLIKQLQTKFSRPSSEQLALQAELEQLGKTHHKEMLVVQYENQQLRKHLTAHSEHSLQLQRQLDEQTVQLRSAQREMNDLHSQLQHLQSAALLLGKKDPQSGPQAKRSVHNSKRIASMAPHLHTSAPPKLTPHPTPAAITPHLYKSHPYDSDDLLGTFDHNLNFPDMSGQFLEETRATFTRLEMEAEELEKSYQQFQHQVATGYAAPHLHEVPSPLYFPRCHPPLVSGVASPPATKPRTTPLVALPSHTSPLSVASFLQQGEAAVVPTVQLPTLTMLASSAPTAAMATVVPSHSLIPHTTDMSPASHTPSITSVVPSHSLIPHATDMSPASHAPSVTSVPQTLSTQYITAAPSPLLASQAPSSIGKPDGTQLSPSPTGIATTPLLSTSETFSSTQLHAQGLTSTVPVIKTPAPTVSLLKGHVLPTATIAPPVFAGTTHVLPTATSAPPVFAGTTHVLPTATSAPPVFAGTTASQTTREALGVHDSSPVQNTVEAAQTDERAIESPESVPSVEQLSESREHLEKTTSAQSRADLASAPMQILQTVSSQPQVISTANPSPRISLDDVWRTSPAPQVSEGAGVMETPPVTSSLLPSSKFPSEVLESSWDLRRRWRQEERERRQREEEEEVRKELETMEREQQQEEVQRSPPSPSSPPPKPSGPDAEPKHGDLESGLDAEPVKNDEDKAVDPVMLKYMELVRQRREHPRTEDNLDPPVERVEPEPKSAEDYGLPPLSQGSESFGGFSDHGDNPFEDW